MLYETVRCIDVHLKSWRLASLIYRTERKTEQEVLKDFWRKGRIAGISLDSFEFVIFLRIWLQNAYSHPQIVFGGLTSKSAASTPTQQAYPSTKARRTDHQIGPPISAQLTAENGSPLFPFTFASLHRGSGRPSNTES